MHSRAMRCDARLPRSRLLGDHPAPQSVACEAKIAAEHQCTVELTTWLQR